MNRVKVISLMEIDSVGIRSMAFGRSVRGFIYDIHVLLLGVGGRHRQVVIGGWAN